MVFPHIVYAECIGISKRERAGDLNAKHRIVCALRYCNSTCVHLRYESLLQKKVLN